MSDEPPTPITSVEQLIKGGFIPVGAWQRDAASGSIKFVGETPLPREPGVYAYAIDGVVHYVGSAQRGLRTRLRHYEIAKTVRTAHRIRGEVLAALANGGKVEVLIIVLLPKTVNGLPVDMVAGLEEGLIRSWRPAWNRRGNGKRS